MTASIRLGILLLVFVAVPIRGDLAVNQLSGFGAGTQITTTELSIWQARVVAAGGTFAVDSVSIASALITQLEGKSYSSHVKYLLPLLGSNLAAARVPLRDSLNVGIATNSGFVDADFSQSTGLQGASGKYLNTLIKPGVLGTSNNGGIGIWTNSYSASGSGTEMIGCYGAGGTSRFLIDPRASSLRYFSWGNPGNLAGDGVSGVAGDYYGQRASSTSRVLYVDGSSVGSNTTNDAGGGSTDNYILVMSADASAYYVGRCAVVYLTDGALSSGDISDLHSMLQTYLITATGR